MPSRTTALDVRSMAEGASLGAVRETARDRDLSGDAGSWRGDRGCGPCHSMSVVAVVVGAAVAVAGLHTAAGHEHGVAVGVVVAAVAGPGLGPGSAPELRGGQSPQLLLPGSSCSDVRSLIRRATGRIELGVRSAAGRPMRPEWWSYLIVWTARRLQEAHARRRREPFRGRGCSGSFTRAWKPDDRRDGLEQTGRLHGPLRRPSRPSGRALTAVCRRKTWSEKDSIRPSKNAKTVGPSRCGGCDCRRGQRLAMEIELAPL